MNVILWSKVLDYLLSLLRTPELAADLSQQPELWAEIKHRADAHRFLALLAYRTAPFLPASERPWRDQVLMTHHHRHSQRLKALRMLLEAFADAGIICVSLKGPFLAERFYEQPYLRPCNDLDLLVYERDIGPAARLMMKLGFLVEGNRPWPLHRDLDKHLDFRPRAMGMPRVEVHYRLEAGGVFRPAGEFLDRSCVWQSPSGFEGRVLLRADDAFYSGVHAASHAFHRLRWLFDTMAIARTLTSEERAHVRELTIRHNQMGSFVAASLGAQEFFQESLTLDCSGFAAPRLWRKLSARNVRRMVERVDGNTANLSEKIGYRLDLCRMTGSPWKAASFLAGNVGFEIRKRWYNLRYKKNPEALIRTLPD